jgi:hypothetical protein
MPNQYQLAFLLFFGASLAGLFTLSHLLQQALSKRGLAPVDLLLLGLPRKSEEVASTSFTDPISTLKKIMSQTNFDLNTFVAQNQIPLGAAAAAVMLTALYMMFGGKPKTPCEPI